MARPASDRRMRRAVRRRGVAALEALLAPHWKAVNLRDALRTLDGLPAG